MPVPQLAYFTFRNTAPPSIALAIRALSDSGQDAAALELEITKLTNNLKRLLITDGDPKPPRSCLKKLASTDGGNGTPTTVSQTKVITSRRARFADELATCIVTGKVLPQTPENQKRIVRVGPFAMAMPPKKKVSYGLGKYLP